jgi:hypothetical protein
VAGFIALLKMAVGDSLTVTFVDPLTGELEMGAAAPRSRLNGLEG